MDTKILGRSGRGLKAKAYPGLGFETSRKTQWLVSSSAPKSVDDLSYTSRDAIGRINWWDVSPPKTNYWGVHQMLGRAYAFEILDLLNNPALRPPIHLPTTHLKARS